ncbi:MAG: 30S ribosomal protein S3 [Caldilineae bacterium]|nr:MAG: 30S ribosomal protein S3 [Caldilineae bacterium]
MGRKVHPTGFRLGIVKDHVSRWYAEGSEYTQLLAEDRAIRERVFNELDRAGVSKIEIERAPKQVSLKIHAAKPGIVIGKKGATVNVLRRELSELTNKRVKIDVEEIKRPELDAKLVADSIAEQLVRRVAHKRAMRQAVQRTMRAGAKGIMIRLSGRLGGAEMARVDSIRDGRIPRHTLRADIDYADTIAQTTYGVVGIKVWIYKGEILPGEPLTV